MICQIDLSTLTSAILRKAANTIVRPGAWVQGDGAFDAKGQRIPPTHPTAVCWSAAAALQEAAAKVFYESAVGGGFEFEMAKLKVSRLEERLDEAVEHGHGHRVSRLESAISVGCDGEDLPPPEDLDDWEPEDFFCGELDWDSYVARLEDAVIELDDDETEETADDLEIKLGEAKAHLDEIQSRIEAYHDSRRDAENELVDASMAAIEGYLGGISLHEIAKIGSPEGGPWHAAVELEARAAALANILCATADRVDAAHEELGNSFPISAVGSL